MGPDFWSMGCALARAEVALVLSMARAANECAQATVRYGSSVATQALWSPRTAIPLDQSRPDPSAQEAHCAYLREIAGIARVSAMIFIETLEGLRPAARAPRPEALEIYRAPAVIKAEELRRGVAEAGAMHLREGAGRTRRSAAKGAASKDFLLY